jgi:hypothetical protein
MADFERPAKTGTYGGAHYTPSRESTAPDSSRAYSNTDWQRTLTAPAPLNTEIDPTFTRSTGGISNISIGKIALGATVVASVSLISAAAGAVMHYALLPGTGGESWSALVQDIPQIASSSWQSFKNEWYAFYSGLGLGPQSGAIFTVAKPSSPTMQLIATPTEAGLLTKQDFINSLAAGRLPLGSLAAAAFGFVVSSILTFTSLMAKQHSLRKD